MKHLKTLETYPCKMHVCATSRSTFATSRQNTCNIRLEQMKHLEHTLEIYVYSHYNICNIRIYFCNIDIQHLQHTSETYETLETYYCKFATCAFSVASACCLDRLIDVELETTECHRGRWCRARRWHEPQQEQADGARPRREREFRSEHLTRRACRARRGRGWGPSREQATRAGAAWASAGSVWTDGCQRYISQTC
jgi:hypothetical protein